MNRNLIVALALSAGLIGGGLSHYVMPLTAFAQTQAPNEIRARSFVLVDDKNNVIGTFKTSEPQINGFNTTGPTVVLIDSRGREIWRAGVSAKALAQN